MVWTPIRPGEEDALRAHLEDLDKADSPLGRSPRTHMARWIVVPDMRRAFRYRRMPVTGETRGYAIVAVVGGGLRSVCSTTQ